MHRRRRLMDDLADDIRDHITRETEDNVARGMTLLEARRAARLTFGNAALIHEDVRRVWIPAWLDCLRQDLVLVTRALRRHPAFSLAAVLTFALGIGLNVAVFATVDRLLFKPLPFVRPERLVHLHTYLGRSPEAAILPGSVALDLANEPQLFAGVAWAEGDTRPTTPEVDALPLSLTSVTVNALSVLGLRPILGRDFRESDVNLPVGERPILVSFETWRRRYGSSADLLGQSWQDGPTTYRIVGVLPGGFLLPTSHLATVPYDGLVATPISETNLRRPGTHIIAPFARLADGVSLPAAQARIDELVATHFSDVRWGPPQPAGTRHVNLLPLQSGIGVVVRPYLWAIVGTVGTVLVVTCFSLMTLMLVWGQSRERDAGLRLALGASPQRLVIGAFAQSFVICIFGALIGWITFRFSQSALLATVPPALRLLSSPSNEFRVVGATVALALAVALVAGATPAMAAWRADILTVLQPERRSRRPRRLISTRSLIALQAAFGVVLAVGASMTVPTFFGALLKSPGFTANDLFVADTSHNFTTDESLSSADGRTRVKALLESTRTMPGVVDVAATTSTAFSSASRSDDTFWSEQGIAGQTWGVTPSFFSTIRARMRFGRTFTGEEISNKSLVAVLSMSAANTLWPESAATAIGRPLMTVDGKRVVIGIVDDFQSHPNLPLEPSLFIPISADEVPAVQNHVQMLIRMAPAQHLDRMVLQQRLSTRFRAGQVQVRSVTDERTKALERPRLLAVLLGTLTGITLLLIAVGLHGVVALDVGTQRRELSIRMALGATPTKLCLGAVARVVIPSAVGAGCGVPLSWWCSQGLTAALPGFPPGQPLSVAAATLAVVLVAGIAAWLPARRISDMRSADVFRSSL
ncbi:MAG: ABC transporter permease [Vicinamibacterales bacterium]